MRQLVELAELVELVVAVEGEVELGFVHGLMAVLLGVVTQVLRVCVGGRADAVRLGSRGARVW